MSNSSKKGTNRDDIQQLRERIELFESYERLAQENLARAAGLAREAQEIRDAVVAELEQARASATQQRYADLAAMRSEVAALRAAADGILARIDNLATAPSLGQPDGEAPDGATAALPIPSSALADAVANAAWLNQQSTPVDGASGVAGTLNPVLQAAVPEALPETVTLLISGVRDLGVARSLIEHYRIQPTIERIEVREFAEGMLRLDLAPGNGFTPADATRWPGRPGITVVNAHLPLIEIQIG